MQDIRRLVILNLSAGAAGEVEPDADADKVKPTVNGR